MLIASQVKGPNKDSVDILEVEDFVEADGLLIGQGACLAPEKLNYVWRAQPWSHRINTLSSVHKDARDREEDRTGRTIHESNDPPGKLAREPNRRSIRNRD